MPSYKLQYFNGRGFAEASRQLFVLSGTPYEDIRIEKEDWPNHKASTPFGQMPVLFVDGKPLPQSSAITRYLAKEFGFAGKNNFEAAWVDALADQFKDYFTEIRPLFVAHMGMGGDKDELLKSVGEPTRDKHMAIYEKILKDNKTGFLVGNSLTWIDLVIAEHIVAVTDMLPGFLDAFPEVLKHSKKIRETPKLQEWIEKRPKTPF